MKYLSVDNIKDNLDEALNLRQQLINKILQVEGQIITLRELIEQSEEEEEDGQETETKTG
jgi:ribosomal protein L18E